MAEEETAIMDICFDEAITVAEYSKTPDSKQKQAYLYQIEKTFLSLEGRRIEYLFKHVPEWTHSDLQDYSGHGGRKCYFLVAITAQTGDGLRVW